MLKFPQLNTYARFAYKFETAFKSASQAKKVPALLQRLHALFKQIGKQSHLIKGMILRPCHTDGHFLIQFQTEQIPVKCAP